MRLSKKEKELLFRALVSLKSDKLRYGNAYCTQPDDETDRRRDLALEEAANADVLLAKLGLR